MLSQALQFNVITSQDSTIAKLAYIDDCGENSIEIFADPGGIERKAESVDDDAQHDTVLEPEAVYEALYVGPEPAPHVHELVAAGLLLVGFQADHGAVLGVHHYRGCSCSGDAAAASPQRGQEAPFSGARSLLSQVVLVRFRPFLIVLLLHETALVPVVF